MRGPEARLTKKVLNRLRSEVGGWWEKIHGGQFKKDLPDIIGCVNGLFVAIELKAPYRKLRGTPLQEYTLHQITMKGKGLAFLSSSVDDVIERVQLYLANVASIKSRGHRLSHRREKKV